MRHRVGFHRSSGLPYVMSPRGSASLWRLVGRVSVRVHVRNDLRALNALDQWISGLHVAVDQLISQRTQNASHRITGQLDDLY